MRKSGDLLLPCVNSPCREEAALKRPMITSARRVVALGGPFEIWAAAGHLFCDLVRLDVLITNIEADASAVAAIEAAGTTVILA